MKEASARIKINKLLENANWRFLDDENGPDNIQLEPNVKLTRKEIDAFGEDFQAAKYGYIGFLLLRERGLWKMDESNIKLIKMVSEK